MSGFGAASIKLPEPVRAQRRVEPCMGTVFSIDVRLPGCDPAVIDDAIRWLHWVDDTFSTYQPASQINSLARGEVTLAQCAPEVAAILARCAELEAETDGYFSAWAGGVLDPSGLVKGWAIQRVSEMLHDAGAVNHCVNGGGDVQCRGRSALAKDWWIGIVDPHDRAKLAGVVVGSDLAVATSGSAERGGHIIDPLTGARPGVLACVSLVGRDLATVDAYATAAFAMGTAAPSWIQSLDGYRGLVVYADGTRWASPGFAC